MTKTVLKIHVTNMHKEEKKDTVGTENCLYEDMEVETWKLSLQDGVTETKSLHRWIRRVEWEGGVIAQVKKHGFYLLYIKKIPNIFFHGKITKSNKYFKIIYLVMEHRRGWRQGGQERRKLSYFSSIGWQGTELLHKFKSCFGELSEIFFFLYILSL